MKQFIIYSVPTSKSTFSHHFTHGPLGQEHADFAALTVALEALNSSNGPIWNAIRGQGLAYGASFGYDHEIGIITLDFYRSPDAYKAFDAVKMMLDDFVSGKVCACLRMPVSFISLNAVWYSRA